MKSSDGFLFVRLNHPRLLYNRFENRVFHAVFVIKLLLFVYILFYKYILFFVVYKSFDTVARLHGAFLRSNCTIKEFVDAKLIYFVSVIPAVSVN